VCVVHEGQGHRFGGGSTVGKERAAACEAGRARGGWKRRSSVTDRSWAVGRPVGRRRSRTAVSFERRSMLT